MSFVRAGRVAAAVVLLAAPALVLSGAGRVAGAASPQMRSSGRPPEAAVAPAATGRSAAYHFVDVAAQAGLTRVVLAGRPGKDHLLDSAGTGAAWLDYDRDGRLDCYIVNDWKIDGEQVVEKGRNALYHQRPDHTFEDVTDVAGVGGEGEWGAGVFAADYDADGWPDMLVTNFGKNVLYRNLGDGRFENVAGRVGLESPGWNTGAAWFDADGDGDLDVYVAQYIDTTLDEVLKAKPTLSWRGLEMVAFGPFGLKGAPDHLFRNDGGRFKDATPRSGHGGQGARLRLFGARGGLRRRRRSRRLRRERLRPELPLPQRRQGALHRGRHLDGLRARRERSGAGRHGPGGRRRQRRRDTRHLRHQLRRGLLDALPRPAGRAVRGRLAQERRRPGHVQDAGLGHLDVATSTTTATSRSRC